MEDKSRGRGKRGVWGRSVGYRGDNQSLSRLYTSFGFNRFKSVFPRKISKENSSIFFEFSWNFLFHQLIQSGQSRFRSIFCMDDKSSRLITQLNRCQHCKTSSIRFTTSISSSSGLYQIIAGDNRTHKADNSS